MEIKNDIKKLHSAVDQILKVSNKFTKNPKLKKYGFKLHDIAHSLLEIVVNLSLDI